MAKYIRADAFEDAARREFAYLVEQGFAAVGTHEYRLKFASGWLAVQVLYDERDGRVFTILTGTVGNRNPTAGLQCLYVEAGLGPQQQIRDIARSMRTLTSALNSQASGLRKLLPVLEGEQGEVLLLRCHGR